MTLKKATRLTEARLNDAGWEIYVPAAKVIAAAMLAHNRVFVCVSLGGGADYSAFFTPDSKFADVLKSFLDKRGQGSDQS